MGHQAEDGELEYAAPRALSSQAVAIQPFMRNTLSHSFRCNGTAGAGDALGSTPFSMIFLLFVAGVQLARQLASVPPALLFLHISLIRGYFKCCSLTVKKILLEHNFC